MTIWDFWTQQNWGCDKKGNCNYVRVCVRINVREYVTIVRLRVRIQVWLHVRIHVKLCLSLHVRVVSLCQNMYIYRWYIWYIYNMIYIYIMYKCTHTSHNSQIQFSQRIHVRQESQSMYMPWIMSCQILNHYIICHYCVIYGGDHTKSTDSVVCGLLFISRRELARALSDVWSGAMDIWWGKGWQDKTNWYLLDLIGWCMLMFSNMCHIST